MNDRLTETDEILKLQSLGFVERDHIASYLVEMEAGKARVEGVQKSRIPTCLSVGIGVTAEAKPFSFSHNWCSSPNRTLKTVFLHSGDLD